MATALKVSPQAGAAGLRCRPAAKCLGAPLRVMSRKITKITASAQRDTSFEVGKALSLAAVASSWAYAGNAQAAQELVQLAASDSRLGIIATLFVPALGWVAFNIAQPAFNQLRNMSEENVGAVTKATKAIKKPKLAAKRRSAAVAIGLGAAALLAAAEQADAATEVAQLAASDNRVGIIATLFLPALGWVAFNIAQPAFNQLRNMSEENSGPVAKAVKKGTKKIQKRRGVSAAIGLGAAATLLAAENADAATELAQLAASDSRLGIIATLFVPALGWVAFNIAQPAFNQLRNMSEENSGPVAKAVKKGTKKIAKRRGISAAAIGLGAAATALVAEQADAATEVAQLAASDNRLGIIATLFLPALGWVAFNIAQPAFNQLRNMSEENSGPVAKAVKKGTKKIQKRRGVSAAIGLGAAATLLAVQGADAATEVAQLAASDNRLGIIATLFAPALGWVAFNIAQPALNQLRNMSEETSAPAPKRAVKAAKRR